MIRLKRTFNGFLARFSRVSPILAVWFLLIQLTVTFTEKLKWRFDGFHYYGIVALVGLGLLALVVFAVWVYSDFLKMHLTEKDALVDVDAFQTAKLTPKEAVMWMATTAPYYHAMADLCEKQGLPGRARDVRDVIHKMDRWCRNGHLDRDVFPDYLDPYYPTMRDARELGWSRMASRKVPPTAAPKVVNPE